MANYRKKSVEIEAVRWTGGDECIREIKALENGDRNRKIAFIGIPPHEVSIETLEGTMKAKFKDYIIKGVQGELYPCKPDIFRKTYEPIVCPDKDCEHLDSRSGCDALECSRL